MAAHPTSAPQPLHANSSFQEDVDHWKHRVNELMNNNKSLEIEGTKSWSSGFFSCFSPPDLCLITCCLPCVTFGKTHHRLHKDKNLAGYSPVNASCLGFWASAYCCLACIPLMLQRSEIRKRSSPHLTGDTAMDFLKAFCCGCCDLIQQEKEAELLLAHEQTQYVTQQPAAVQHDMNYAPPPQQPAMGGAPANEKVGL